MFQESHGKQLCRENVWSTIGANKRLPNGKHLILAGQRAGDIPVLLKKGVPQRNIIAVDRVGLYTARAKQRWPKIEVRNEDVIDTIFTRGPNLSSMYLDWCGIISHQNIRLTVTAACEGLKRHGWLACTFFASRDELREVKRASKIHGPYLGRARIISQKLYDKSLAYMGGSLALVPIKFVWYANYQGHPMITYVGKLTTPNLNKKEVRFCIY